MRDIHNISLRDLVPDSICDDPDISAAIDAIDGEIRAVSSVAGEPAILARIDEHGHDVLNHLAWQFNAVTWRDRWPLDVKRSVLKSIIIEQAKKGTTYAVKRAVQSYGSSIDIKEWWQKSPMGTPHTFEMVLNLNTLGGELVEAEIQEDLLRRIDDVKPARSQYTFSIATQVTGAVGLIGAARPVAYARIVANE